MLRRSFLAGCASATLWTPAHSAEPLKLIVPFPPGGSLDNLTRMLGDRLRPALGTVVIENRAGANGQVGAASVAAAVPDGRTLLMGSDGVYTVNPLLYKSSTLNPNTELEPLGLIAYVPSLLVVPAASPIRSVGEFIAAARSKDITYASGGNGSAGHLTMASFASAIGARMTHVAYRGGAPAVMALMGGEVAAAFLALPNALQQVKAGKLRALAVSSLQRVPQLSDTPTAAEAGVKGFEVRTAYLLIAPAKTPLDMRAKLESLLMEAASSKDFQAHVAEQGMQPAAVNAKDTKAWLAAERRRWSEVIDKHGITAD